MGKVLEICIDNIQSFHNAVAGGATRIELCSALSEGGLTPSPGFLKSVKEANNKKIPIFCMLRCRGGFDFNYSNEEIQIMVEDAKILKQNGADGFVFGALNENFDIDLKKNHEIIKTCYPLPVTFHRAFDVCKNPYSALETISDLGFKRILTSGQCSNALDGAENIKKIKNKSKGKVIIVAGCGVNEFNLQEILNITGVSEIHGSASSLKNIVKEEQKPKLLVEETIKVTDVDKVKKLVHILNDVNSC